MVNLNKYLSSCNNNDHLYRCLLYIWLSLPTKTKTTLYNWLKITLKLLNQVIYPSFFGSYLITFTNSIRLSNISRIEHSFQRSYRVIVEYVGIKTRFLQGFIYWLPTLFHFSSERAAEQIIVIFMENRADKHNKKLILSAME